MPIWDRSSAPDRFSLSKARRIGQYTTKKPKSNFSIYTRTTRKLGLAERCVWGLFDGKHEIHGRGSFPFLDKWLGHDPRV